nr:MAG TPA: hypothetical protein [Inoviridae sp.]
MKINGKTNIERFYQNPSGYSIRANRVTIKPLFSDGLSS